MEAEFRRTTCPHDCPSVCALDVEVTSEKSIGRVRGSREQTYTAGVICGKVSRYKERVHHPDRLKQALRRVGEKGAGEWQAISIDQALDEVAEALLKAEAKYGSETVWPYYFAGTMGVIQRDSINRFRHAKKYSGEFCTICTTPVWGGFTAGTGRLGGVDPREMAKSDLVIIWGTNPVNTQVNVMTHAVRARKERGAKIAVVDIYETNTMKQADIKICLKPGTDAALACALMHVLFSDGYADREYLNRYTDDPVGLERHLQTKTPHWASEITQVPVEVIESFARLVGETNRTFFRIGYGLGRQRTGAVSTHAVLSIPAVGGHWQYEGGGAFHSNSGTFGINSDLLEGRQYIDPEIRTLDQSRIGAVLLGEEDVLYGGPPVTALFIQNTNPIVVAPAQEKVKKGFAREDLFVCVHEQFMTETAQMADIVLPATMFVEHDDFYKGGGHQHLALGEKLIDPPRDCMSNYKVLAELAKRLGVSDESFEISEREHIDRLLKASGRGSYEEIAQENWMDVQPSFEESHYLSGFAWPDGKFRFKPKWEDVGEIAQPPSSMGLQGPHAEMPEFPDYWAVNEAVDEVHPLKLATSPSRSFLNTSFTESITGRKREGRPSVFIHPADAASYSVADGDAVILGNARGEVHLHAIVSERAPLGTLIAEGIWPNDTHENGNGINTLIGDDPIAPFGGAAFHDASVWLKRLQPAEG